MQLTRALVALEITAPEEFVACAAVTGIIKRNVLQLVVVCSERIDK